MSIITNVDIEKAQTQLEQLVNLANAGNEIVISKDNIPVAKLVAVPVKQAGRRTPDLHRGAMCAHHDFNEPLPDSFWLEGK